MVFDSFCKINISYGTILVFLRNGNLLDLSTNCSCGHGCKRCCTLGPKSNNCLYGLGHVFNDLSASMWFSYLMLFFVSVLEMKATVAGTLMLLGQVVDALATPVVGIVADKYHTKKFWHLFGCILVSISFPLIFFRFWGLENNDNNIIELVTPVYYSVLITFFQIGWTFVQISHLAMIPIISEDLSVRASLTSIRYIASVLSCLSVYIITWVVFRTDHSAVIGPPDDYKFKYIAIIVTAMGVATFLMFQILFTLNERSRSKGSSMDDDDESQENLMYFLKKPVLYKASFLYVFSRLYWALNIVYIPLFIEERLLINSENGSQLVATVPLVLYISSLCFSIFLKSKYNGMGHHVTYLFGSVLSLASALWVMFINPYTSIFHIYIIAILIGAGSSITFISSLCITSDLIGTNTTQGASIYSIVTFADKLITGIAIAVLEYMKCTDNKQCPQYYKGVLTYPCGASVILGLLSLLVSKIFGNKK